VIDYSKVFTTEPIREIEAAWASQLPDLRDPELAVKIQDYTGYEKYIESVRDAVRRHCGRRFIMYGAVSDLTFGLWRDGEALRPMGLTLVKGLAKAAKRGVPLEGKKFVIFQTYVELPWIVIRGRAEDEELVVDATQVSYHTLSVIG